MKKYNFTPRVQKAISSSKNLAESLGSHDINLSHLLFSILESKQSTILSFFQDVNVSLEDFKLLVFDFEKTASIHSLDSNFNQKDIDYDTHYKKVFKLAFSFADELEHGYVGIEHLFYILLVYEKSPLPNLLNDFNVDVEKGREKLKNFFISGEWEEKKSPKRKDVEKRSADSEFFNSYAINYNELAISGKFDNIISKDLEINELSEILCRRNKNNPILTGPPGTGKTTLIEGLAQKIVSGDVTNFLLDKIIYEIDLAGMIAGTKYRGQFEERLKSLIDEASNNEKIILFIDEIHTLIGAGSAEGSMDAANILKPALSKGFIKCIGATTSKEYSKSIEKDSALQRRFQEIKVKEPSKKETSKIIQGILNKYEDFHHVKYRKNAVNLAIELSDRYINDRHFPDKAIDIIDQAGSRVKMKNFHKPNSAKRIELQIEELMKKEDDNPKKAHSLKKRQEKLIEKYKDILSNWMKEYKQKNFYVTCDDIYEIMSSKTGIPSERLSRQNAEVVLNLNKKLNKKVLHQQGAVDSIHNCLMRAESGLREHVRPIGSFLFLGKSGVGKTLLAKALAEEYFGDKSNLIALDMSEFSEKINVSRLIGAAPGYVGYEDGGQLTDRIKQSPYSVVLFDEIEKAHPEVINVLLQILEEGRVTDGFGRVSDFKNSIIIMTGNLGAEILDKTPSIGFSPTSESHEDKIIELSKKQFSPEFVNRIDDIVIFNNFTRVEIRKIVNNQIEKLANKLKSKNINLDIAEDAIEELVSKVLSLNSGARPVEKLIQKNIENQVSEFIIKGQGKNININKNSLIF